jgi:hypothetical protein
MSVASINNGTLQLSDLLISNEKYSNSAGYAPSTASFSASLTNTSIFVPSVESKSVTINSSTTADYVTLTCVGQGEVNVETLVLGVEGSQTILESPEEGTLKIAGGQLQIVQAGSTAYVNLSCTGQGEANVETLVLGVDGSQTILESQEAGTLKIAGGLLQIVQPASTDYVNINCTGQGEANVEFLVVGADPNQVTLSCTFPDTLTLFSVRPNQIIDTNGSAGAANQVLTANGDGTFAWK